MCIVFLEHKTFSRKDRLKHRVKRISKNALIMIVCGHFPTTRVPYWRGNIAHLPSQNALHVSRLEPEIQDEVFSPVFAKRTHFR
ncbi:hypothetical protein TNCV_2609331 [Trichonephila clavipes]|nr:hypothetical protein TNCV_2609331 [Trichonephila clavipes]